MSTVRYIRGCARFIRGQWRVWCYDTRHNTPYWGFPGDENAVPVGAAARDYKRFLGAPAAARTFRKVPGAARGADSGTLTLAVLS